MMKVNKWWLMKALCLMGLWITYTSSMVINWSRLVENRIVYLLVPMYIGLFVFTIINLGVFEGDKRNE